MGEQGELEESGKTVRLSCRSYPSVGEMEGCVGKVFNGVCVSKSLGKPRLPIRGVAGLTRMGLPGYPSCIQSLAGSSLWSVALSLEGGVLHQLCSLQQI